MYRVKLAPDDERQFESREAFQDAMRRGLVGPAALVLAEGEAHWILVANSPEYVAVATPPPPSEPAPPIDLAPTAVVLSLDTDADKPDGEAASASGARALAAARNILRDYRRDLRLIERGYLDTLTGFRPAQLSEASARAWETRAVRAEAYDVSTVADSMVQTMDSLLTFLRQRPGHYRLAAGQLAFEDADDRTLYNHFRRRLRALAAIDAVRAPAGGTLPATIAELARASE